MLLNFSLIVQVLDVMLILPRLKLRLAVQSAAKAQKSMDSGQIRHRGGRRLGESTCQIVE